MATEHGEELGQTLGFVDHQTPVAREQEPWIRAHPVEVQRMFQVQVFIVREDHAREGRLANLTRPEIVTAGNSRANLRTRAAATRGWSIQED